jgi:hypothetical protein
MLPAQTFKLDFQQRLDVTCLRLLPDFQTRRRPTATNLTDNDTINRISARPAQDQGQGAFGMQQGAGLGR